VAVVGALVIAEGAVLALRPRGRLPGARPVPAREYFTPAELRRARDFRGPQLALSGVGALVEAGVLAFLVARPPRRLRRVWRRPLAAGAGAGAALSVLLGLAPLPVSAIARRRARDVGLVTQSWGGWAGDVAKSTVIDALLAAAGGAAGVGLMRRWPRWWWLPGAGLAVAVGAGFLLLSPVLLDPVFNRFKPLAPGPVRTDVLDLARRADVRVGEVYEVDASRRTTAANAYVTGLGATKRVVLFDTLLGSFSRDEARLVVAHELGHVHYSDVPRGLLYLALVAPGALLGAALMTRRLAPAPADGGRAGPEVLPALALSLALVGGAVGVISNGLSRAIERRADAFALRLTDAPEPFISFERRITLRNVGDPDPPAWQTLLLGTHPSTVQRIGMARAFEVEKGGVLTWPQ
jgi:STE24 endopeptidase